jgi:superfamily II DNA or RNA helicase
MATIQHLLANLDRSLQVQVRGQQFEHICKWFLENEPGYRSQLKRVWLWNEWPDAWAPDAGIDLVAEAANGDLWAIQAKAYSDTTSITKRDVNTFLSESSRPQFAFRLLIATTNEIGRTAERTLKDQEKPVGRLLLSDLERYELDWPRSPADLRPVKPKPKKPRPHQREAIDAVLRGFEEHDRGRLIMACGTGKTLVGLWVAEELGSERTLVLLPSLSLLAQTLREWTANASRPFAFLPVCSDESVRGEDHFVSNTSELGFPVTTDPAEIAAFLDADGPSVVFSTYQSSPKIAEALELSCASFDLAIADEAHRCAGPVSSDFATILDNGVIRAERRLFQTATPRIFTDRVRNVAGEAEYEIASMNDEKHFGPEFHCLSFGDAIERDLLSDYQVVIVGVDDPTYRDYVERGTLVTRDGKEKRDARYLASQIALAKAMRDYDLRRTISFHSRVGWADDFASEFADVVAWMPEDERPSGDLWCDHVHGKMPSGQRDRRLKRLRELADTERGLLTNARCLGEGVDVPTLDGVAFIDPRNSQVDIIQAVGRAIRKADDKKLGTIVLPVFIEETDDPEESLRGSDFKPVWGVLKALRAHDKPLADELDAARQEMGRKGRKPKRIPPKVKLDVPKSVGTDFVLAFQTELVEQTTESWEFWYGLLESYLEREGDAGVPYDHEEGGKELGKWAIRQRFERKTIGLSDARVARLESLPGWTWDRHQTSWDEGIACFKTFVAREGHGLVPTEHIEGTFRLGAWVSEQRHARKVGRLSPSRSLRLDALPKWVWDAKEAIWEAFFDTLRAYIAREGHSRVPHNHTEEGYGLGRWVGNRRGDWRAGRLSLDRVARFEALPGWIWDTEEAAWEEGFEYLHSYVSREGNANVPYLHTEGNFKLGTWTSQQRRHRKAGRLSPDRIARLEDLHGWIWDRHQALWEEGFESFQSFVEREGHTRVPRGHREGAWATKQRRLRNEGRLSPDRIARLEALPGWVWDATKKKDDD